MSAPPAPPAPPPPPTAEIVKGDQTPGSYLTSAPLLVNAHPDFATASVVAIPNFLFPDGAATSTQEIFNIINASESLSIRQHFKWAPKCCARGCFTCPCCSPQENTYSVYAGIKDDDNFEIMRIDEVSDDWNRLCCKPFHPLKLEVRQYIPVPRDGSSSDYAHLTQDAIKSFDNMVGRDTPGHGRSEFLKAEQALYEKQPVMFTMLRDDGKRCCFKCPCKALGGFACFDFCKDGMTVYAGETPQIGGKELGRPYELDRPDMVNRRMAHVKQPKCGGGFKPSLDIYVGATDTIDPWAIVLGPCFFGGLSEFCCNFQFDVKRSHGTPNFANFIKVRPKSAANVAKQCCSTADNYQMNFAPKEGTGTKLELKVEEKLALLTSSILADYMWFDGDTSWCVCTNRDARLNCCFFNCMGCIIPIYIDCADIYTCVQNMK